MDLSCMRISHTETAIAFEGLVACAARCGTHTNQLYKNFSFTRENCRDGVYKIDIRISHTEMRNATLVSLSRK